MSATVQYYTLFTQLHACRISSPDHNAHQLHEGLVQAVKEVAKWPALLPHPAQHEAKSYGEHHQAQSIDSIAGVWGGH